MPATWRSAAALGALAILMLGCTGSTTPTGSVSTQAATSSRTGPVISAPPVTPPTPPGDNLPAFACKDVSGGTSPSSQVSITAIRVGEQGSFDRFVLQFDSQVPQFTVKRLPKPSFTAGASGQAMTLIGSAGVLVTLKPATGQGQYTGPTDLSPPAFTVLKEARQVQDFEGTVQWGIGLGSPVCLRAFSLTDPARLVIDFSTGS